MQFKKHRIYCYVLALLIQTSCRTSQNQETENSDTQIAPVVAWLIQYTVTRVAAGAIISVGSETYTSIHRFGSDNDMGDCTEHVYNGNVIIQKYGELLYTGPKHTTEYHRVSAYECFD